MLEHNRSRTLALLCPTEIHYMLGPISVKCSQKSMSVSDRNYSIWGIHLIFAEHTAIFLLLKFTEPDDVGQIYGCITQDGAV